MMDALILLRLLDKFERPHTEWFERALVGAEIVELLDVIRAQSGYNSDDRLRYMANVLMLSVDELRAVAALNRADRTREAVYSLIDQNVGQGGEPDVF